MNLKSRKPFEDKEFDRNAYELEELNKRLKEKQEVEEKVLDDTKVSAVVVPQPVEIQVLILRFSKHKIIKFIKFFSIEKERFH